MSNGRNRPQRRSPNSIETPLYGQSNPSARESAQMRSPAREFARFHEEIREDRIVCAHYELKREIARGGMAVVHEAVDQNTGEHVALKIAPESEFPYVSPRFIEREIAALSKIKHDNVVGFIEEGEHDSDQFLVMEYIDGSTLRDLMVEYGQLPWEVAGPILIQLCDALQAVHDAEMVHSDVKPPNIILSGTMENPVVKLLDFGIVKFTDAPDGDAGRETAEGTVLGTPKYMAPEQVLGDPFDQRADIYALGTIMYGMLTGQGPFPQISPARMYYAIVELAPDSPKDVVPGLSPVLSEITMKALEKRPEDRFSTAKEMGDALRACQ